MKKLFFALILMLSSINIFSEYRVEWFIALKNEMGNPDWKIRGFVRDICRYIGSQEGLMYNLIRVLQITPTLKRSSFKKLIRMKQNYPDK